MRACSPRSPSREPPLGADPGGWRVHTARGDSPGDAAQEPWGRGELGRFPGLSVSFP